MWKRGYFWGGIIGAILFILGVVGVVNIGLVSPSDLLKVNIANVCQYLLYVLLGVFLMAIFLKGRSKDDAGHAYVKLAPDSPEDIASLRRKRNLIFAFVLLFGIIVDCQIWVLNNYAAGLTLINVLDIFDLVLNIVFLYAAVQLFRDKKGIEKTLLYTMVLYVLVEAVIFGIMGQWGSVVANLLYGSFFVYAIIASVNRKSFRIGQFVILPIAIIFGLFIAGPINGYSLSQLQKSHSFIDLMYGVDNSQVADDYAFFIQSSLPSAADIKNIQNDASTTSSALQQDVSILEAIRAVYEQQVPNVPQQLAIEQINKTIAIAAVYQRQYTVVQQLMAYAATVNFSALTKSQAAEINSMEQQINAFQKQASSLAYKLANNE
jgi:hypothetical protein